MTDVGEVVPSKKKFVWLMIGALIIIGVVGVASFRQYMKMQHAIADSNLAGTKEAQELVSKVSQFIVLPEDEIPTIATVSDYTKLQDQQFFAKSQNGDKVLFYTKAKKAYLYRPATNKLIDVTNININSSPTPQPTAGQ